MKWYSGEIAEAIKESKSKGAIFVVYIEGNDDKSKIVTDLFEKSILGERLKADNFVAIKIQAGSLTHQQFSEFYKDPSVPSIYFIGKDGNPLDIIKGNDDLSKLNPRIDDILSKAGVVVESVTALQKSDSSCDIVCENDVCRIIRKDETENNEATTSSEIKENRELTPEEKVERAKELLEAKRKQKDKEQEETERIKEMERRKMGQSVQELKRWQKEQELKQLFEEREKEKLEQKLARERVLAQIKQDKEERLSKSQPLSTTSADTAPKPVSPSSFQIKSDRTRLQFKLPDGSSNTQEFSISDTLQSVIGYIKENLKLPFNSFKLSTTFPRREFSSGDNSQTLLDLQLCPNAVILILPQTNSAVTSNVGGPLTTILWSLFSPILSIFGYLKSLILGKNQNTTGTKRPPDDMGEPRPPNPKKRVLRDSTVVKRQGNIHRLTDRDSSDDEGNTWNGNSTQQM